MPEEYGLDAGIQKLISEANNIQNLFSGENNYEQIADTCRRLEEQLSNIPLVLSNILKFEQKVQELSGALQGESITDVFSVREILEAFVRIQYNSYWVPTLDIPWVDIVNAVRHANCDAMGSEIDEIMFAYYTNDRIIAMKTEWKQLYDKEHIIRIFSECIDAYERGAYGLVVIAMSTQWEGVIKTKCPQENKSKRFNKLQDASNEAEFLKTYVERYYDKYITANCQSDNGPGPDVPARHGSAHGELRAYPTKKAALNAILFTDIVLRLPKL